jgi:hypothetical protein
MFTIHGANIERIYIVNAQSRSGIAIDNHVEAAQCLTRGALLEQPVRMDPDADVAWAITVTFQSQRLQMIIQEIAMRSVCWRNRRAILWRRKVDRDVPVRVTTHVGIEVPPAAAGGITVDIVSRSCWRAFRVFVINVIKNL